MIKLFLRIYLGSIEGGPTEKLYEIYDVNTTGIVEFETQEQYIQLYYDDKDVIKKITLEINSEEIPLYPISIQLPDKDETLNYIPNIIIDKTRLGNILQDDDGSSILSLDIGYLKNYVQYKLQGADRELFLFLEETLNPIDFARIVFEQFVIQNHLLLNQENLNKDDFKKEIGSIHSKWPDYYPGKDEYYLEYVPSLSEIKTVHMLNNIIWICKNPRQFPFTKQYFSLEELEIVNNATLNREGSVSSYEYQLLTKLIGYHRFKYPVEQKIIFDYIENWIDHLKNTKRQKCPSIPLRALWDYASYIMRKR